MDKRYNLWYLPDNRWARHHINGVYSNERHVVHLTFFQATQALEARSTPSNFEIREIPLPEEERRRIHADKYL
jgi:hypothetical protein